MFVAKGLLEFGQQVISPLFVGERQRLSRKWYDLLVANPYARTGGAPPFVWLTTSGLPNVDGAGHTTSFSRVDRAV